jgi:hypothetical protein
MKKITAILVALTMVMAVSIPAVTATDVTTQAQVASAGSPPVIEYMFVLSDSGDALHSTPGTQIMPNPGTGTTEVLTHFKKYVVVSDPNGIADIAAVYEKLINTTGAETPEVVTTDITATAEQDAALNEALNSNLITQAEYDDMVYKLDPTKAQAKMFMVENSLTNHDKPGVYTVYFKAVDKGAAFIEDTTTFEYMALKALELDFNAINYGTIVINTKQVVSGDTVFNPPSATKPTVKNQGNQELQIKVSATNLVGQSAPSQIIPPSALSVHLLGQDVPSLSTTPTTLDGFLQPCTPTQIDFDITAPYGTSANTYSGTMSITIA